ncbi:MAG: hypothetical protein L0H73_00970 [Nitrococcus sp.]|nr:hypothetical protein [Nitrococcus sp.]
MSRLILEPSATAAWHRVVTEAASDAECELDEQRESYLVFLLMRYLRRPELVRSVFALKFLQALLSRGRMRRDRLQEVGDQCLIFAGLFPEQAERRRVRLSYFVDLGRSAYSDLADAPHAGSAELFHTLACTFVVLTDVLRAIRQRDGSPAMTALQAAECSLETDSALARRMLRHYTKATLVAPTGQRRH